MVKVAAIQMSHQGSIDRNREKAIELIEEAAEAGCNIILLPELYEYSELKDRVKQAFSWEEHPMKAEFEEMAKDFNVVLPISFYEKNEDGYFDSIAVIDANGETIGIYRKSHRHDGQDSIRNFYFSPQDSKYKVWDTAFGKIGVGIRWDQWFPVGAKTMSSKGADLILYPVAVGTDSESRHSDSIDQWVSSLRETAGLNSVPIITANSVGQSFYGSSFITGFKGDLKATADRYNDEIITANFDLDLIRSARAS